MRRSGRLVAGAAAVVAVAALAGCTAAAATSPSSASVAPQAGTVSARVLLAGLRIEAPDHSHPYDRAVFGYGDDFDPDGDGCYTHREVLIRDHIGTIRVGHDCFVQSTWRSLYDDRTTTEARSLEIDHLVPLAEAWHAGAWRWSARQLLAYGNDLGYEWSLQAVTAALNQDKQSKDPAQWLPPKNRCTYVQAWIAVKSRWGLSVDPAERRALLQVLDGCASPLVLAPGTPDLRALTGS